MSGDDGIKLKTGRRLAVLQGQEVSLGGFQHRGPVGQEPAGVLMRLVPLKGVAVAVQLVEDPLPRIPLNRVTGVDQGFALVLADAGGGLFRQPVECHF